MTIVKSCSGKWLPAASLTSPMPPRPSGLRWRPLVRQSAVFLIACLSFGIEIAAEPRPQSLLVMGRSDARGPFYAEIFSSLRRAVDANSPVPVTMYLEHLDFSRSNGTLYELSLGDHFRVKYRDRPIGAIVTIGSSSLDYGLGWRNQLWPGVPVVFGMVHPSPETFTRRCWEQPFNWRSKI